jgi:ABC transporter substrate binding protein
LAQIPVDLIVAQGAAVSVISMLNLHIPVVYVFSGDPVSAGFATSLAKPKGNTTGLSFMALNGKRLELLREIIPELRRVAVVANPEHPGEHLERSYSEKTGSEKTGLRLGITIEYFPTRSQEDLTAALSGETTARDIAICRRVCNRESPAPSARNFWMAHLGSQRCHLHLRTSACRVLPALGALCRSRAQSAKPTELQLSNRRNSSS